MVKLIDNGNGGELVIDNNDIAIEQSIYTQLYLLLFGGNQAGEKSWVGNLYLNDVKFNNNIENDLNNTLLTSSSLIELQSNITNICNDLITNHIATSFEISLQALNTNKLNIKITLYSDDNSNVFSYLYDTNTNLLSIEN